MTKLLAGMDVSGDPSSGNYKYIAIIICTAEHVNSLRKRLHMDQISLNKLEKNKSREIIASELQLEGDDCLILCCKIMQDVIIQKILASKRKKKEFVSADKIRLTFNRTIYRYLNNRITDFLSHHGCDKYDVYFQSDSDCVEFAKATSLLRTSEGEIHVIADVIAWLNNKKRELPGIINLDLTNELYRQFRIKR